MFKQLQENREKIMSKFIQAAQQGLDISQDAGKFYLDCLHLVMMFEKEEPEKSAFFRSFLHTILMDFASLRAALDLGKTDDDFAFLQSVEFAMRKHLDETNNNESTILH